MLIHDEKKTNAEAAKALADFYASTNGAPAVGNTECAASRSFHRVNPRIGDRRDVQAQLLENLNEPIKPAETANILSNLPNRKAPGNDGLAYELVKLTVRTHTSQVNATQDTAEAKMTAIDDTISALAQSDPDSSRDDGNYGLSTMTRELLRIAHGTIDGQRGTPADHTEATEQENKSRQRQNRKDSRVWWRQATIHRTQKQLSQIKLESEATHCNSHDEKKKKFEITGGERTALTDAVVFY